MSNATKQVLYELSYNDYTHTVRCEKIPVFKETEKLYILYDNSRIKKDEIGCLDAWCNRMYMLSLDKNWFANALKARYDKKLRQAEEQALECKTQIAMIDTNFDEAMDKAITEMKGETERRNQ